ncbi:SAM-dependent methyltransferase [Gloeothece citriformis PCC 7424]|uniref:SAM-dependent methyltransferase n=1 Tax=Gloeothece citriformis (strain PCC 7424) TaxID=65393 RepID=B7K7U4_GLOC7|nr:methyltransferase domain-containing protein [Gloeothece citriformis]ACK71140.1 SAM-dependent methyltransferase [Gloeothece citriformis PCC 7424]
MNLKIRSYQLEMLDSDHIPDEDIYQNLRELRYINTWLGGHRAIISGLEAFQKKYRNLFQLTPNSSMNNQLSIYEIGSGGGDNLYAIYQWSKKQHIPLNLGGIDLKETCINFAQKTYKNFPMNWYISDYKKWDVIHQKPDIIFNSLFCHHFTDEQLVEMFRWMKNNSNLGFFICDLHRHPLAYYSIKLLTQLFSKSYLVKNDAPLSVRRGFQKNELEILLNKAGIESYQIKWQWGFRYLIIVFNEDKESQYSL